MGALFGFKTEGLIDIVLKPDKLLNLGDGLSDVSFQLVVVLMSIWNAKNQLFLSEKTPGSPLI